MSAWSDAGWPAGIFFARPRLAVNLIIAAVNELRVAMNATPIQTISEFLPNPNLRGKLREIDFILASLIESRQLSWDYNRWGTDRYDWYPTWIEAAVGDCPRLYDDGAILPSQFVLRWVISRYKILCNCNRWRATTNYGEYRGIASGGWSHYTTEAERTAYVLQALEDRYLISAIAVGAQFKMIDGDYCVRRAVSSRLRVLGGYNAFRGSGRYLALGKIVDGGYAEFDSDLAPGAINELWTSPMSDLVAFESPDVDVTFYDRYWAYPYNISPGTATVDRGFGILTQLVVDLSNRQYYDPPEVWQTINV